MACFCKTRQQPSPICCCSWPPKQHPCYCQPRPSIPNLLTCQNNVPNCPCRADYCRPRQPPLRIMQKALVDKWTELEKLGQLAHMYWCQHRALRHQLACMQSKYCRLQSQCCSDMEPQDYSGMARGRPEHPSVYQGILRIRDKEQAPNQLCICNNPEAMTTYRGVVKVHDQDEGGAIPYGPAVNGMDYGMQTENLRLECEMKAVNLKLTEINKCEEELHERLQKLREELATLQTKIKSHWGQNALDKCTPAKENQTRFF